MEKPHIGFYVEHALNDRLEPIAYGLKSEMLRVFLDKAVDQYELAGDDELVFHKLAVGRYELVISEGEDA